MSLSHRRKHSSHKRQLRITLKMAARNFLPRSIRLKNAMHLGKTFLAVIFSVIVLSSLMHGSLILKLKTFPLKSLFHHCVIQTRPKILDRLSKNSLIQVSIPNFAQQNILYIEGLLDYSKHLERSIKCRFLFSYQYL